MNIKRIAAVLSAVCVLTFSIGATSVYAADDVSADSVVEETSNSNLFSDVDSLKGAKTWDNSDKAVAGYAVMSIAAFGAALAVAKNKKRSIEKEADTDNEK